MSDTPPNPATAPAASGAITQEQLNKAIADAVTAAVKPLNDQVTALQTELQTVRDTAKASADQQAAAAAASAAAATAAADAQAKEKAKEAREAFVAGNLKDVPQIYQGQLGEDPAKWADQAKTIREGYAKDLEAAGVKAAPVSSGAPGGAAPAIDTSKLSAGELIAMGVKQSSTAIIPGAPVSTPAPATAPATASPTVEGGGEAKA